MTPKHTTEALIADLAQRPLPVAFSGGFTLRGLAVALAVPLGLFWLFSGFRADLGQAVLLLPVQAKTVLPLALSVLAVGLAIRSARPGRRFALWPLAVPFLAGVVLVVLRLRDGSATPLWPEFMGQTALVCLGSITLMSALPLFVAIRLFRHAAPTRPGMTGALLGLATASGIAAGYALHCTEDSPLFFMTWYSLAICIPTGFGAVLGHRFLRW